MRMLVVSCIRIILVGAILYATNSISRELPFSDIRADESLVFFRTSAWLDERNQEWQVPIHGWIYEPEDSLVRKELLEVLLKRQFDLAPGEQTDANFRRRLSLLIADNERSKRIVVAIAGRHYTLPPSSANGHFEVTLKIPVDTVDEFREQALIHFSAVTKADDPREFAGEVILVQPQGLSVISDIDDTIKISNVNDRRSLLENTFLLDFTAAPDMAPLYRNWSKHGLSFHYVSSSPWQLYEPLREFLHDTDFPPSTLRLKAVRFRDKTLFDLFKKGTETKPAEIEKILRTYPQRRFILVGDSGEQDPEVYATILRKYPQQVLKAYIRNVTQESSGNTRFKAVFAGISNDRWQLFEDPEILALPGHRQESIPGASFVRHQHHQQRHHGRCRLHKQN